MPTTKCETPLPRLRPLNSAQSPASISPRVLRFRVIPLRADALSAWTFKVVVVDAVNLFQFKLPTIELTPSVSSAILRVCWPEGRVIPFLAIVVQMLKPPVAGTLMAPDLLTPSMLTWKVPPTPGLATRADKL